jgi:hypothetical protein
MGRQPREELTGPGGHWLFAEQCSVRARFDEPSEAMLVVLRLVVCRAALGDIFGVSKVFPSNKLPEKRNFRL